MKIFEELTSASGKAWGLSLFGRKITIHIWVYGKPKKEKPSKWIIVRKKLSENSYRVFRRRK